MKALKQNQTDNHQKEGSKREDKKKTNIKFNSSIFFQLGLVVALIASAWAMNLNIEKRTIVPKSNKGITIDEPTFIMPVLAQPEIEPVKTIARVVQPPVQRLISNKFEVKEDDTKEVETKLVAVITAPDVPVVPIIKPPVVAPPIKNTGPTNMNTVEFAPIFPGCESAGNKIAQIECMNDKISHFVARKFDTNVADNSTSGNQRITVQFKIDKNGNVVDIKALAKDKNLEKEAQRVISRLPGFTPGKMGDVAVDVMYMLPIYFQID